jgi:long-chain acyl-CoA synthetase
MEYQTVLQSFLDNSAKFSDRAFLHQPDKQQWRTFTFAQTEHQARCIASGLKAQGFKQGDRIGVISKNCAEWFIADLAIMMAGMISVPIYPTAGHKTISFVVEHCNMKAIFVGKFDALGAAEAAINPGVLRIAFPYPTVSASEYWLQWLDKYPAIEEQYQADIDDCMSIVYTSGTTGDPKGVVISFKNLASAAKCTVDLIDVVIEDRLLSYLPLAHITERSVIECVAFHAAPQVYFVESLDTFINDLRHASPTFFVSVPRLWAKFQAQVLAELPAKKLDFLLRLPVVGKRVAKKIRTRLGLNDTRKFGTGSAPIAVSLLQWFQRIGIDISEGWGMTETSGLSCGNMPFTAEHIGTIGVPLDCVEMKLSADKEILIRGDAVFSHYYLAPEMTEASYTGDWFHTGDCGQVTDDGIFRIVGRVKEQFKTAKGKYVAPVPIEQLLCRNSHIEQICVMGIGLKQPLALVVLGEGKSAKDPVLVSELKSTLSDVNAELESHQRLEYMFICKDPWTVENDLLTPTLKLKRHQIERFYSAKLPSDIPAEVIVE